MMFSCDVVPTAGFSSTAWKKIDFHMSDHQSVIFKALSAPLSAALYLSLASLTCVRL